MVVVKLGASDCHDIISCLRGGDKLVNNSRKTFLANKLEQAEEETDREREARIARIDAVPAGFKGETSEASFIYSPETDVFFIVLEERGPEGATYCATFEYMAISAEEAIEKCLKDTHLEDRWRVISAFATLKSNVIRKPVKPVRSQEWSL